MAIFHEDLIWPRVIPSERDAEHEVEYWFWDGHQLLPAPSDAAERARQREAWEQLVALEAREQQPERRRQLWRLGLRAFLSFVALRSR